MMMFLIRNDGRRPEGLEVKLRRRTPALVARGADLVDWFCLGDPEAARHDDQVAEIVNVRKAIFGA
jgi:hypothetical protein